MLGALLQREHLIDCAKLCFLKNEAENQISVKHTNMTALVKLVSRFLLKRKRSQVIRFV